jgi:hypothetical protein
MTPEPEPLVLTLSITVQRPSRQTPPKQGRPLADSQSVLLCEGLQIRQPLAGSAELIS